MKKVNYKTYIKAVVSKSNKAEAMSSRNLAYEELCKWLRDNGIKLEREMFRAVLHTCEQLKRQFENKGEMSSVKEISDVMSMFFHTFTGEDGIHTDAKLLQKYVEQVFPIIKKRLDEELAYGCYDLRLKKVDVVSVGRLFDGILSNINDDALQEKIEERMNDFVLHDLSD